MPVSEVKADHQTTMRVSTRRAPMRSPIAPPGISKMAYESVNAPTTQPDSFGEMSKSDCMRGPATEMQTRSRYVMFERKKNRMRARWRYLNMFICYWSLVRCHLSFVICHLLSAE